MAELEIERDDRVVAMERRVHRIAVVVMTLVVLSGVLGVSASARSRPRHARVQASPSPTSGSRATALRCG